MKKRNGKIDFVLGGAFLVVLGLATLYFEKAYFTINPVITVEKTPIIFWCVVIIEIVAGIGLFVMGLKMNSVSRRKESLDHLTKSADCVS